MIFQAKKTFLFHDGEPWKKKGEKEFDVTMGSLDGAETCELIGLYLLSQLQHLGISIGLYRDDGLAASKFSAQKTENIKKEIVKIFQENNLKITITANLKVVDFLDVTFDLTLGSYKPFINQKTRFNGGGGRGVGNVEESKIEYFFHIKIHCPNYTIIHKMWVTIKKKN